jgi:hypothetical protein
MEATPERVSLRSLLENPRPITVALYFRASDAPKLWDLARRHVPDSDDMSWFAAAARGAERGLPAIAELTLDEQVDQIGPFFIRHGIEPPRIEDLRI